MQLYKLETGLPATARNFAEDHPGVMLVPGADLEMFGYGWAQIQNRPAEMAGKVLEQGPVQEVDDEKVIVWVYRDMTAEELATLQAQRLVQVRAERDRRLGLDFEFNGKWFQRDEKSIARISGAGTLALAAMMQGAQPGDLFWHGREEPFAWIASDDTLMTMDAQTCFAFGRKAAAVETEIIFAAKQLREMETLPENFADDQWWP